MDRAHVAVVTGESNKIWKMAFLGLLSLAHLAPAQSTAVKPAPKPEKNRMQWISTIRKIELDAVRAAKESVPSMAAIRSGLEKLKSVVADKAMSFELRLQGAASMATICHWEKAMTACRDTLNGLVADLNHSEDDESVANYIQAYNGRFLAGEKNQPTVSPEAKKPEVIVLQPKNEEEELDASEAVLGVRATL